MNELPKLPELPINRLINFSSSTSWGITDVARFNALMEEALTLVSPGYYLGDNIFTWCRNNSAFEDKVFSKSFNNNTQNTSDQAIVWRRYILACCGYHCLHFTGDFVECGVYAGTGIKTVMDYLGGKQFPKTFWGYDTFDYSTVKGNCIEEQSKGFYEKVSERFSDYEQVNLVRGLIPDSFSQGLPDNIAYLHIDLNNADSEIAALEFLFDKVVAGGIIILDDYEWAGAYRSQKKAEDPWFQSRDYRVFPLPTGQGLVLKR